MDIHQRISNLEETTPASITVELNWAVINAKGEIIENFCDKAEAENICAAGNFDF